MASHYTTNGVKRTHRPYRQLRCRTESTNHGEWNAEKQSHPPSCDNAPNQCQMEWIVRRNNHRMHRRQKVFHANVRRYQIVGNPVNTSSANRKNDNSNGFQRHHVDFTYANAFVQVASSGILPSKNLPTVFAMIYPICFEWINVGMNRKSKSLLLRMMCRFFRRYYEYCGLPLGGLECIMHGN